jgi:hypothetical protein
VSGYLARLVGRHMEPPVVRPRAVSRFEDDLVGGTIQPEAEPTDGPPTAAAAAPNAPVPVRKTSHESTSDPAGPFIGRSEDRSEAVPAAAPRQVGRAATAVPRPTAPTRPRRTDDVPQRPPVDPPASRTARDTAAVTPVAIRRAASPQMAASPSAGEPSARRHAGRASREPDVVHVHIGRVEVKAMVPPKETPRAAPRRARPAPLSLDRYLAGERQS